MKKRRNIFSTIAPYGLCDADQPDPSDVCSRVRGDLADFSFTKYNLLLDPEFIKLDNYKRMLGDPKMHMAVVNTLKVMVMVVPLQVVLPCCFRCWWHPESTR